MLNFFVTSGYEEASFRQYQRNTKQMKVNMEDYERQKEKMWVLFVIGQACPKSDISFIQMSKEINALILLVILLHYL